jgi:hypothetical protein
MDMHQLCSESQVRLSVWNVATEVARQIPARLIQDEICLQILRKRWEVLERLFKKF